jgi:hypothetical protein
MRRDLAKHQLSVVSLSHYSPNLDPADFFLFPKLKTTFKRTVFPNHRRGSGKCDKITARDRRKCVPGSIPTMEETFGMVYRQ